MQRAVVWGRRQDEPEPGTHRPSAATPHRCAPAGSPRPGRGATVSGPSRELREGPDTEAGGGSGAAVRPAPSGPGRRAYTAGTGPLPALVPAAASAPDSGPGSGSGRTFVRASREYQCALVFGTRARVS